MKETKKHKDSINFLIALVQEKNLSATEFRYITAQVRTKCNLIMPKRPKKLPDYLNGGEIYTFLEKASKNNLTGILAEFLIFTGLRISEATNLMIQDIDFNNNQLKVVRGKGAKDRYVPITNNLLHKIKLFIQDRRTGYLFCKSNMKPYTKRALQTRITNVIEECNFSKNLSTHSLRHTFACMCLARNIDINKIKLLLGHSSIKTTEIYAKLELGHVKEEFLRLMNSS